MRVTKDLDISLEGADVLIVEDIVDSGVTLNYLMHLMEQRRPRSLRIAALLDKPRSTGIWMIFACWTNRRRRNEGNGANTMFGLNSRNSLNLFACAVG